jgi:signal recognition particle receptor subunit alpha
VLAARERLKNKGKPTSSSGKAADASKAPPSQEGKELRTWVSVSDKISKKDMEKIDVSKDKTGAIDLDYQKSIYLGGDDDKLEGFYNSDDEIDFENFKKGNKGQKQGSGLFSKLTSAFQSIAGNKVLSEDDVDQVLKNFKTNLMEKNVAAEIADNLCKSVKATLIDKRTESFTSVKTTVKNALVDSIQKLLTPKKNIDLLKDALTAKQKGQVYSAVFIGVNGVGKSTSLAKVAYYLKTKGNLRVMIAGCDNFRSGAIEQLQTHCQCLDVPLYEKGYKDDPAIIAKEALQEAKSKGYDVLLIDTAGRMQGNENLMRALAKLVHINNPDVVLFVGEALVGNDAIDQLTKFNQSLIDYAISDTNPRAIDGIVLTKFDTVDEKVGTALNMVYTTGKPIVFVGVGQKYPHLKKLNVQTVISALMS